MSDLTSASVREMFKVENGLIGDPGKFEGQPIYVPYLYNLFLQGCADLDATDNPTLRLLAEDFARFPELASDGHGPGDVLVLLISDQGFVEVSQDN